MPVVDHIREKTMDRSPLGWILISVLAGVGAGLIFALLNGGSMLLCLTYLPGEIDYPPDAFRPIHDIVHSHLVLCVRKEGLLSLIFILIGALTPCTWPASLGSVGIYVPRCACIGAGVGLCAALFAIARDRMTQQED